MITEISLPDIDGVLACRQIRKISNLPILFLSSKNKPSEKMAAFEAGADDYVLKPCYLPEIFARLQVHLRRKDGSSFRLPLCIDGIMVINRGKFSLLIIERLKSLPKNLNCWRCFVKMSTLLYHAAKSLSEFGVLIIWEMIAPLILIIRSLRRKIEPYHTYIRTVWGYGYKLSKD